MVVLAVAIAIGVSRWLRSVDDSLYDTGICPPGRQLHQPSATQYFAAVAAVGGTLSTLCAVVLT